MKSTADNLARTTEPSLLLLLRLLQRADVLDDRFAPALDVRPLGVRRETCSPQACFTKRSEAEFMQ